MKTARIPIIRRDEDGTVVDGTAELIIVDENSFRVVDFRDLDGEELHLPPQSSFEFITDLPVDMPWPMAAPIHLDLETSELDEGELEVIVATYSCCKPSLFYRLGSLFRKIIRRDPDA